MSAPPAPTFPRGFVVVSILGGKFRNFLVVRSEGFRAINFPVVEKCKKYIIKNVDFFARFFSLHFCSFSFKRAQKRLFLRTM